MRITLCALVGAVLAACASPSSPEFDEVDGGGTSGGAGGNVSLWGGGGRAGGGSPPVVLPSEDGGVDAAQSHAQDAADAAEPDACPCDADYEACSGGQCRSCTVIADTFERPDADEVGAAEYPAGSTWRTVMDQPDDPAVYGVRDGALVRLDPGLAILSYSAAVIDQGETLSAFRLRMSTTGWLDVALNASEGGLHDALRANATSLSIELCDGSDCVHGPGATYGNIELFHEVVLDGTTLTGTTAEGTYASEGGSVKVTVTREVTSIGSGRLTMIYIDGSIGHLTGLSLERYPCEF